MRLHFTLLFYSDLNDATLNVEGGDRHPDGLDKITKSHSAFLPFILRQYETILDHRRTCTSGRMAFDRETVTGLYSELRFACTACGANATVKTQPDGAERVNKAAVWGNVASGSNFFQMKEFLALLNVKGPSANYYRKLEENIGQVSPCCLRMHLSAACHAPRIVPLKFYYFPGMGGPPQNCDERGHRGGEAPRAGRWGRV